MQEMRGLLGREQVIALSATTTSAAENAPVTHESGPQRGDVAAELSSKDTLIERVRRLLGR